MSDSGWVALDMAREQWYFPMGASTQAPLTSAKPMVMAFSSFPMGVLTKASGIEIAAMETGY